MPMKKVTLKTLFIIFTYFISLCTYAKSSTYEKFDFPHISSDTPPLTVFDPSGSELNFIRTGKNTCDQYLFAKLIVPPHQGPPPHIHHWTDEWFWAPDGGISLFMGHKEYPDLKKYPGHGAEKDDLQVLEMRPKELFYGKRFIIHGFINHTNQPKELYIVWTPDDKKSSILNYFINAGGVKNKDHTAPDGLAKIKFVSTATQYGINQSKDFWEYVNNIEYGHQPSHMENQKSRLISLLSNSGKNCSS